MNWKFWRKESADFKLLADVLSSQLAQASLFTMPKYGGEKNLVDAKQIFSHSRTAGYSAWASEAWMEAVGQIKKISQSKDQREVDQAVGALRSTLHLLGVSFSAQRMIEKQAEASSTPKDVKQGAPHGK